MRSGITVNIYRPHYDCTGGGVTSAARGHNEALLLLDEGGPNDEEWAARHGYPVLRVVRRHLFGAEYLHAEPVNPKPDGYAGYMFGGNLVYCSDSRFPNRYPLKVHDRAESPREFKTPDPEAFANAHVQKAAPDLLEACKRLLASSMDYTEWHENGAGTTPPDIAWSKKIEDAARAAIAKAEGRT